jgi:hypothetical protein
MKHGSGIKDREDKSSGIEILITEAFVKINPTEPLRLGKQAGRRIRKTRVNDPVSPVIHEVGPMLHDEYAKIEDD